MVGIVHGPAAIPADHIRGETETARYLKARLARASTADVWEDAARRVIRYYLFARPVVGLTAPAAVYDELAARSAGHVTVCGVEVTRGGVPLLTS